MWQVLYPELRAAGIEVVAVALDTAGRSAAEPKIRPTGLDELPDVIRRLRGWAPELWAAKAPPEFPCLIDTEHRLAELYGIVNVPTAVWIDEQGQIVRPPEPAGVTDHFRSMDPVTFAIPDSDATALEGNRQRYLDALRDWGANGARSAYALDAEEVIRRTKRPTDDEARAAVHVRIARHLHEAGDVEGAEAHLRDAARLSEDRWIYRRQAGVLEPDLVGALNVSDEYYAAMESLGDERFYPPIEMPDMDNRPSWGSAQR